MRKVNAFILGAVLNLLFNITAGLINHNVAIRITRWGWLYFLLHASYLIITTKSVKQGAIRFRLRFGGAKMLSYIVVALLGAILSLAYWEAINRTYSNVFRLQEDETKPLSGKAAPASNSIASSTNAISMQREESTSSIPSNLEETNAEIRTIYNRFLSNMREALKEYQKNGSANLYIAIPDLPVNLFSPEAARYNGGATFSQYAAWTFFLKTESKNPTLDLEFMNGDGHTVGGRGIGTVLFQYDPKTKTMNIKATGVGQTAFGKTEQRMSTSEFKSAAPAIVKSLIDYQLDHL